MRNGLKYYFKQIVYLWEWQNYIPPIPVVVHVIPDEGSNTNTKDATNEK